MKIYDSRPDCDLLLARCKRDQVDPGLLVEVVVPRGHYAIRCYGRPTTTHEFDGAQAREVPAFVLYHQMRNGRISNGWGLPYKASEMLEVTNARFL